MAEHEYSPLPPWQRTDCCGTLRTSDAGRDVALLGWVATRRDHGGLIFIDLRDREGIVQIVFNPEHNAAAHEVAREMRSEFYVAIKGRVVLRGENTVNAQLPTGAIEVAATAAEILNASLPPPFPIGDDGAAAEELRLRYRYLDLRRPAMQRNLRLRHIAVKAVRDYLDGNGFIEVETPILWKATPEGARDYLVPSRVNPGRFYALPQSPQLLKQLLMIGGFDRYYQIARCFRDEDLRANRQPEFTQIDIEMTCPRPDDVMALVEGMMSSVYERALGIRLAPPFIRMPFEQAMDRFGIDKPDMRFDLELKNLGPAFAATEFRVFREALGRGDAIYGLRLPAEHQLARRELDGLDAELKSRHGLGLAWARLAEAGWQGPIAKFVGDAERQRAAEITSAQTGDTLLILAGPRDKIRAQLGELRLELGSRFALAKPDAVRFLWVVDFPLFEYDEIEKRIGACHHPFTAPHPNDLFKLDREPLSARSLHYDLVLNGQELGSGSIRIHSRELQLKVLEIVGFSREEAMDKFGFLIEALSFGAPPHGGIAFGVDRIAMMLCGVDSIRDVVAFPKTQKAVDPMSGAPSQVDARQLRELSIKIVP